MLDQRYKELLQSSLHNLQPIPTPLKSTKIKVDSIKAVLFDIYGTLLISGSGDISLAETNNRNAGIKGLLEARGLGIKNDLSDETFRQSYFSKIKEHQQRLLEMGADYPEVDIRLIWQDLLFQWQQEGILQGSLNKSTLEQIALAYELSVNPVSPMPGATELLAKLRSRNIPLGIVSNAQFYTPLCLEYLLGSSLEELGFQQELSSWSYQVLRGKPSKEIFQRPMEQLKLRGIEAQNVLYVGNDMLNDIYTATQWGCKTALFAGDQRSLRLRESNKVCGNLSPDVIICQLKELEEII